MGAPRRLQVADLQLLWGRLGLLRCGLLILLAPGLDGLGPFPTLLRLRLRRLLPGLLGDRRGSDVFPRARWPVVVVVVLVLVLVVTVAVDLHHLVVGLVLALALPRRRLRLGFTKDGLFEDNPWIVSADNVSVIQG